jgi:predicted acylesterase/phospholipase RssA
MTDCKVALCLGGGGMTGAMYQIGVLAALEDAVDGLEAHGFDTYVAASSGSSVAAALAGGRSIQRIYRAILDPTDDYFPLERKHLLKTDLAEWRRTIVSGGAALRQSASSFVLRGPPTKPAALWEELDRFNDSLPAGLFSLDGFERFLEDFFVRREVPNTFSAMPKALRIVAYDLDSGTQVRFGDPGFDHVPVTRACIASMALAPLFSPVRIGMRHYIDAGAAQVAHLDAAVDQGADVIIVINPMVPITAQDVPTGHGPRSSLRDKGMLWVLSQALRISVHQLMQEACARISRERGADVVLIEPEQTDGILFTHNPASFSARRAILEFGYRSTRARVSRWFAAGSGAADRVGWRPRAEVTMRPPPSVTSVIPPSNR